MKVFAGLLTSAFVATLGLSVSPFGSGGISPTAVGIYLLPAGILAFVVGLPAFLVVNRFGWANALTSSLAGFAIGCLGFWLIPDIPAWDGLPLSTTDLVVRYLNFGGIGLVSGFSFWLVWRFPRPKPISAGQDA